MIDSTDGDEIEQKNGGGEEGKTNWGSSYL